MHQPCPHIHIVSLIFTVCPTLVVFKISNYSSCNSNTLSFLLRCGSRPASAVHILKLELDIQRDSNSLGKASMFSLLTITPLERPLIHLVIVCVSFQRPSRRRCPPPIYTLNVGMCRTLCGVGRKTTHVPLILLSGAPTNKP